MNSKSPGAIIVTGGSRGLGAAVARLAATRGHPVAILFHSNEHAAASVVADIEQVGGEALAIRGDVASEGDVAAAFDRVVARFGHISGLVNNAGITGGLARVSEVREEQLATLMAINVSAYLLCAKEAVRCMATDLGHAGGAIVNLSSRASSSGAPNTWVHYAATKGAVDTMTIGLARELAQRGIRVNAVRPGFIDTEIHAERPPGTLDALLTTVPMGRMGTADEVANAVLWLLSAEASYVSGALLDVSGAA